MRTFILLLSIHFLCFAGNLTIGAADTSHQIQEAVSKGAPDITHAWGLTDYQKFYKYVFNLPSSVMLPHLSSPKSGALIKKYERHIALSILKEKSLSADDRMKIAFDMNDVVTGTMGLYMKRHNSTGNYSSELAILGGTMFVFWSNMVSSHDDMLKTLNHADPYHSKFKAELENQKNSILRWFKLWARIAKLPNLFSKDDNIHFSSYVGKYGPILIKYLHPDQKETIKKVLIEVVERNPIPQVRKIAESFLKNSFND